MKKTLLISFALLVLVLIIKINPKGKVMTNYVKASVTNVISKPPSHIKKEGNSIATRVLVPKGYQRVKYAKNSFQEYLRNYKLKPHGSPIINYDGSLYFAQDWHDAILEVPVPKNGLQQCADALMRIRAEYLWKVNRTEEIGFKFTSGHYCSWKKYANGFRPQINGNKVSFHKTASVNHTQKNFYKYLDLIYTYSGTASLHAELPKVKVNTLKVGDMLVKPGFPGHIEIIVDAIINESGEKLFLLAQGNTPAQNVCLLKNFEDESISPWYKFTENETVFTPSYYFDPPVFVRFK